MDVEKAEQPFQVGVLLLPSAPDILAESASAAEASGFDLVGLGDSQSIARELYVSMTVVAQATKTVRFGPTVSNLVTRHPAVSVSGICTLDELSGGRAFLGLGAGDSALYNLGLSAVRLKALEAGLDACRQMMHGDTVDWAGGESHVQWANRDVPVFLSAEGPRTLALAGAKADGVFIGNGIDESSIQFAESRLAVGRETVGRSASDLEVWGFAKCGLADHRDDALNSIKMALAGSANHAFRGGIEGKNVPPEHVESIKKLRAAYEYRDHERATGSANASLPDQFGLTDWLAERFAVVGTASDCLDKLERLARQGLDGVLLTAFAERPAGFIERFGREVLTPFRSRAARAKP